jgi:hypothetical protein
MLKVVPAIPNRAQREPCYLESVAFAVLLVRSFKLFTHDEFNVQYVITGKACINPILCEVSHGNLQHFTDAFR